MPLRLEGGGLASLHLGQLPRGLQSGAHGCMAPCRPALLSPPPASCTAVRLSVGLVLWLALNIEVSSLGSLKPGGSR